MLQGDHHQEIRHHFWRMKYTELNEIFAFMSLRSLAISLIAIFIPIYLYQFGFTLREVISLYLIMYLVEAAFEYVTAISLKRVGPKHLIALSVPLLAFHFFQLLSLGKINWPIWSMGLSGGLTLALYWQSYHYDFSRAKHRKKSGREVGRMYIILTILSAFAPLMGGFLAKNFGVPFVLSLVILILLSATAILFKTADSNFIPGKLRLKKIKIIKIIKDVVAYGGNNIEVACAGTIWPLFLYLVVKGYGAVGLITSISALISVAITYYVAKKSDFGQRQKFVRLGGSLNSLIAISKIFATTVPRAFGINILKSIAYSVQASPFVSEYYLHADEESRSEYIYFMELFNDLSKLAFFSVLFILTYFVPEGSVLIIGLIIGGLAGFLTTLMPAAECEICGPLKDRSIRLMPRPKR